MFVFSHYINYIAVYLAAPSTDYFYSYNPSNFAFFLYTINYFVSMYFYSLAAKSPGYQNTPKQPKQENEDRFYCEKCEHHCLLRCSHCSACCACILRRDHHCIWLGQCVGQNNHAHFYIYIFLESINCIASLIFTLKGLFYRFKYHNKNYNGFLLIYLLPWAIYCSGLSFLIFLEQTNNILNNLTGWEVARWNNVSYLKGFPYKKSPFDKGVVKNVKEFFTMRGRKLIYPPPRLFL
ncbi:DHHC zinc finger domain containing protein [Trichomonas vaginalis G3]|uniref:Palmitoyltransferase n=1 Tax=Trichomonas vaginalis (strain ATCC PRA-98 / G3) TaxID=412133 RepID=A2GBI9_TRIV3|nr:cysteine S-palmitoyltransferase protein [Trichomonas vaginalis G3]EAX85480.1 DHHC zinc finger domain containing protein [Trichomonas vaginalis G3]KAI5499881.1 cysteine S-palmitoyltransferase protein [Trichomonas vaginalis G3]|eukprot:XP_001298410.1 DHHC zinc finger domain containing protein [Trichomonas vaginalis G3]